MRYLFVIVFAVFTASLWSQNYVIGGFSVTIKGSSNLHDWESYVKEVRANGQIITDATGLKEIKSLYVEMPVKSIKSPKGSIMDGKTYDALKANNHKNITYKLEKATVGKKGDYYDVNATGSLMVAGVTKQVQLYVKGTVSGNDITFKGSKKMKMTDFGIEPPTALMGTMTTANDIEIVFQITMKKS